MRRIRKNTDITNEKKLETLTGQYKVFRLIPEGQEQLDFVEWASDLTRNHPIAQAYQKIRKNHFDKLRKKLQTQEKNSSVE